MTVSPMQDASGLAYEMMGTQAELRSRFPQ